MRLPRTSQQVRPVRLTRLALSPRRRSRSQVPTARHTCRAARRGCTADWGALPSGALPSGALPTPPPGPPPGILAAGPVIVDDMTAARSVDACLTPTRSLGDAGFAMARSREWHPNQGGYFGRGGTGNGTGNSTEDGPENGTENLAFKVLLTAFTISCGGSFLNMVALNLFAYTTTRSAVFLGLLLALRFGSGFAGGAVAGGLISAVGAKRVMLTSSGCQAIALVALILAPPAARSGVLCMVAATTGCGNSIFLVALRGRIPDLVGYAARGRANSLLATARSIAMAVGFASSGLVISEVGYSAAFAADAATFVLCCLLLAWLPLARASSQTARGRAKVFSRLVTGQVAAVRRLRMTPMLFAIMAIRTADAAGSAAHNTALPVYSAMLNHVNPSFFLSIFWTCWAAGNLLVQQAVRLYLKRGHVMIGDKTFAVCTILMSAGFVLVFAGLPTILAAAAAACAGAADGVTEVAYYSRLQAFPADLRDYALGLSTTLETCAFGLGAIISSALIGHLPIFDIVASAHGFAATITLIFLVFFICRERRYGDGTGGSACRRDRDVLQVSRVAQL
jgi:MFS family permease